MQDNDNNIRKHHDVKRDSPKAWLLAARPKTLSGAAVPVMIGLALTYNDTMSSDLVSFNVTAAVLCFLFAMIMQIDANFINDFFDFAKGTDDSEKRLGPRRACAQGWVSIDRMKHAIAATTCLACVTGLPLVFFGGLEMILIGLLCVIFSVRHFGLSILRHSSGYNCILPSVPHRHLDRVLGFSRLRHCYRCIAHCKQFPRPRHRQGIRQTNHRCEVWCHYCTAYLSCHRMDSLRPLFTVLGRRPPSCIRPSYYLRCSSQFHLAKDKTHLPREGPQHLPWGNRTQYLHLWSDSHNRLVALTPIPFH